MRPTDEIKDRLDLVDLIGRDADLTRDGSHFRCSCVFHTEKTASMHVWSDHYHCFGCGAHGDVFDYVQATQSLDFAAALRELARLANVTLREDPEAARKHQEHLSRVALLRKAAVLYHEKLTDEVRNYLHQRGFTDAFLESYLVGWAPGGVIGKLGSITDLKQAGLVNVHGYDYFRGRIIFPVWGRYQDEIVDLAGRVFGEGEPKFLKLPGEMTLINERALRGQKTIYLTEGDTDTASAVQLGLPVVGVRGVNGLKDDFVERFAHVETIYVCADSDDPKVRADGRIEEPRGLQLVRRAGAVFGNRARIVTIPKVTLPDGNVGKDINDYALKAGMDLAPLAKDAPPFLDWLIGQVPQPLALDQIDSEIQTFLSPLKALSKAGQDAYTRRIAKLLGVGVAAIREELRVSANGTNGHQKGGLDGTQIIWGDKTMINPAQALVDGVMHTTVFLDKLVVDPETEASKMQTLPHAITSERKLFELTESEMFARGLRYSPTKVPSFGVLKQRWRIGPDYPFSVKNYLDGGISVDPWDVYTEVVGYFRRYVWYPNPLYYDFLALWVCATYYFELFEAFPYVHLLGTKRCGKTLTLEIISELAFNAFQASSLTGAAAYRTVEMCSATLLIDEAENLQRREKDADSDNDKLEILKSGYKRGGQAIRCSGDNHEPTSYDVYSPKVFGGTMAIDRILGDRVIPLMLARKDKDATVEEFSRTQHVGSLHQTRDKLHILMLEQAKEVSERIVEGIQWNGVTDRDRELWTPILILAAFFDDYYLAQLADDAPVEASNLLTAKMRKLAAESVIERQARDRIDQVEVVIIEAILEYIQDHQPLVETWYATKPLFEWLQERDELSWLKSINRVYSELEKTTAIEKARDLGRKRPAGADKTIKLQSCIRLQREKFLAVARRLGGGEGGSL